MSLSSHLKFSLRELMAKMLNGTPHFVRYAFMCALSDL